MDTTAVKAFRVGDGTAVAQYLGGLRTDYNKQRWLRVNSGVSDYYQLLEPINIGFSEDFELQVIVHMITAAQGNIFGSNNDAISSRLTVNPTGQLVIVLNGKLVNMGAYTEFDKLSTIIIKRSGGSSCTVTVNGIQKGAFIESGAIDIDWFCKEKATVIELEGILAEFKLWRDGDRTTGQLTDWYKFDNPNSIYQRNHVVPQGVELQPSILGEDFGGFKPETSNGQITIVGDEFRAAKISNAGPANVRRVIPLEAGKTYKITVQHSSAEAGIRGMAVGSPNDGSGSAKWDYYSGWMYSDSNGRSELVVTPDFSNIWLYLSSGLTVGSYIGYSNISIQEWSGAEIINGMPEDWGLKESAAGRSDWYNSRYFRDNPGVGNSATFSDPISIPPGEPFELEISLATDYSTSNQCILSSNNSDPDRIYINSQGYVIFKMGVYATLSGSRPYNDGKINTFSLLVSGTSVSLLEDGVIVDTGPISDVGVNWTTLMARGDNGAIPFIGILAEIKLWRGGDRSTGQLTDWYKLDEPNTDHQRNYALNMGIELVTNGSFSKGLYGWTPTNVTDSAAIVNGGLSMTYVSLQQICQQSIPTEVDKKYLLKVSVRDLTSTYGIQIGDLSLGNQFVQGDLEFLFTGTSNNLLQLKKGGTSDSHVLFDNVSIREFHGCTILGGMSTDWFEVEMPLQATYWLSTTNEFVPSRISGGWADTGSGTYTKVVDVTGDLGEYFTNSPISGLYSVSFDVLAYNDTSLFVYSRDSTNNINSTVYGPVSTGSYQVDITPLEGGGLWFARISFEGELSNVSFNRKLEVV